MSSLPKSKNARSRFAPAARELFSVELRPVGAVRIYPPMVYVYELNHIAIHPNNSSRTTIGADLPQSARLLVNDDSESGRFRVIRLEALQYGCFR
jgi:hypothetical protein